MTTVGYAKKQWIPLAGIGILAALVSVSFSGAVRVNAQSPVAATPNLIGDWLTQSWGSCGFYNVWDPLEEPHCGEMPPGLRLTITIQRGRAFAGTFPDLPESKITGAVGEDGTFVMQGWAGNNRMFFSGELYFTRKILEMRAKGSEFEDWKANIPSMSSTWFTARKVN